MIKASVTDAAALADRSPADVSAYLRSRGWRLVERDSVTAVWIQSIGGDELEVVQPLNPALRDYASRVRDVVVVLAVAERRSELDILQAISNTAMDVHTVRLFPADQPPGLIGIEDGVLAYESLRALVSSAAYTVFSDRPRVVQPSRKPQGLNEFLRDVRIGPAAEGTFVLTVHTPVPPRLSMDGVAPDAAEPVPVERQVSLRIVDSASAALVAADAALVADDGLRYFTESVDHGVSANLCEALAGLGGIGLHPFELSLAPATSWPTPAPRTVRFRRDHLAVLRQAASDMRSRTPEENVVVVGSVVRLHREANSTGEISVVGRIDDGDVFRRIWMDLPGELYDVAVRAHDQTIDISVRGNLTRRGNRMYLVDPADFGLAAGDGG